MPGIFNKIATSVATSVASNVTIPVVGMSIPVAAGQVVSLEANLLLTVGSAGGAKVELSFPTLGRFTGFLSLINYSTNAIVDVAVIVDGETRDFSVANALASAGTHYATIKGVVDNTNGAAGTIDVMAGQNTTDATALSVDNLSTLEWGSIPLK